MLALIPLAQLAITYGPKVLRFAKKFLPIGEREKKALDTVANIVELAGGDTKQAATELSKLPEEDRLAFATTMNDHAESMEEIRANIIESVNRTMRVEAQSDNWWVSGWRPFIGYVMGLAFIYFTVILGVVVYYAVMEPDIKALKAIPDIIAALVPWFAMLAAVNGITSWTRGREKEARAGK